MPDETKRYRPDVTGLRNADKRAQLGDFVAHPAAVASRPGRRLESDPYYKATQAGFRQPEPGLPKSQLPNILSPHHRIDVMGSQPYFEGSTDVQRLQRFEDLAVGDLFPGNDPNNYIGLFDGVKSDKAGVKTGIYSDDHNIAHIDMDETRRKMNLTTAGGSKASVSLSTKISELPEDVKTALIADLSLRDELSFNRILQDRVNMAQQAFPNASYNEIKEMLLKDPKGIANLYKTETGALATRLHPKFNKGVARLVPGFGAAAGLSAIGERAKAGDFEGAIGEGIATVVGEIPGGDLLVMEAEGRAAGERMPSNVTPDQYTQMQIQKAKNLKSIPEQISNEAKWAVNNPSEAIKNVAEAGLTTALTAGKQAFDSPMLAPYTTPIKAIKGAMRFFGF